MLPIYFFGSCVGHTGLLLYVLNRLYALPLPRRAFGIVRVIVGLLILAGPGILWLSFDLERGDDFPWCRGQGWRQFLAIHLISCLAIGFVFVPSLIIQGFLRSRSQFLLSNHTRTLDVSAQLGYKPIGQGKHRHLARLPWNQVFQVDFCERTLGLPALPSGWDGLSILHLSDLHLSGTPDLIFYQQVMDQCRYWDPDLVAVTGDFVDSCQYHAWIVPVLARLRWRLAAFAVLGNHDRWHEPALIRQCLRRLKIHVLGNRWEQITIRGKPLVVIGHEGPWFRPAPDLKGCPAEVFRLCLSHTPDNILWAQQNKINLLLGGHNHGGQVRFPLIGPILVPSLYGRRYDCGTFAEPPTVMHVSRGLAGEQPLRFCCRPEVTKIILRNKD